MALADQILDVHEIDGGFWSFNPTMDDFEYEDDDPIDAGTNQRHKSATSDFVSLMFPPPQLGSLRRAFSFGDVCPHSQTHAMSDLRKSWLKARHKSKRMLRLVTTQTKAPLPDWPKM